MSLDPIRVTEEIRTSYTRYLSTAFRLRDPRLRELFYQEVDKYSFTNGPFLEATPPFENGCFLSDFIEQEILDRRLEDFVYQAFPVFQKKPLYLHQERAIQNIANGRNVVVASGTSSGKTEAFLLPIYSHLLREHREGRPNRGVRALLLYPMNALVNDQLRRLRNIAKIIESQMPETKITFGRYTGDTESDPKKAREKFYQSNPCQQPVGSELLSRKEMWDNPPHILITNYAMLEYLLLRPDDSVFFDGPDARHWKFLVLDEAHVYNGAAGIEIAMLIRRLKDRVCNGREGVLQCIATSATLGQDEEEDRKKVAEFARNLFGERFEPEEDIVGGKRRELLVTAAGSFDFPLNAYAKLDEVIRSDSNPSERLERLYKICEHGGIPNTLLAEACAAANGDAKKFLYEVFSNEAKIQHLREKLKTEPAKLDDCAKQIAPKDIPLDDALAGIKSLINVAVWARPDQDSLPLLPARYHLFVRAPEGIFVSFYPTPHVHLERRESTEKGHPVFELASCRRCGQEYLIGNISNGKLLHPVNHVETPAEMSRRKIFLLWEPSTTLEDDEDEEVAIPEEVSEKGKIWTLCVGCGGIWESEYNSTCTCVEKLDTKRTLIEIDTKEGILNKCYLCGLRSVNIVREFVFQQDAPASVLATALYRNLEKRTPEEKKILVFSDSRQDAAFFAPYLGNTYQHILFRRLIFEALQQNESGSDYGLESLCEDVVKIAERNSVFDSGMDRKQKKKQAWGHILQEFCNWNPRIGLEGVGLVSFEPVFPQRWEPIGKLAQSGWRLLPEETKSLYQILLNTLRSKMAITFPGDGPSPQDETFAPRNKFYTFRGEKSDAKSGINSFIPSVGHHNGRSEFLAKLYKRINDSEPNQDEVRNTLGAIWSDLLVHWTSHGLYQFNDKNAGVLFQLNYKLWRVVRQDSASSCFVCNHCGLITTINVQEVCPTFGCNGSLQPLQSSARWSEIERNHYRHLYSTLTPSKMTVHEHTAQLETDYASTVQDNFVRGAINILSCSTTFELGVNLGDLESIFLRNVPPEPANYIQRSGRAGRSLDSAGFTLTFAQLRSHDLTYFREPEKMVAGCIKPPVVEICNEKIVRRHLHSMVLSSFLRAYPDYFGSVDTFFHLSEEKRKLPSGPVLLREYLDCKPPTILESLKRTVPMDLHKMFDLENWGWVDGLLDASKKGVLAIAQEKISDAYSEIEEFYNCRDKKYASTRNQSVRNKLNYDMNWANDSMERIRKKKLIDCLATHAVIPKYGFPVDVVELTPLHHIPAAKQIQLERDLRIAISEFAPGSQVVANGYVWESAGLRIPRHRALEIRDYAICPYCNRFQMRSGTIEESITPFGLCSNCKRELSRSSTQRFIVPSFGFVTSREVEPQPPGEARPKREFSTRPFFFGCEEPSEEEFSIMKLVVKCQYSSTGELAVICKGRKGAGFYLCFNCGYASSGRPKKTGHRRPIGEECSSPLKGPYHLGHTFITDVVLMSFKGYEVIQGTGEEFWFSLLYATLEGVSEALGIRRHDLDGCLYPFENKIALVLFDSVPGGAGHVKRLMEGQNLQESLVSAKRRMEKCDGCKSETSCYGCLRNYQNQFCHEKLKRGVVLEFLSHNIGD